MAPTTRVEVSQEEHELQAAERIPRDLALVKIENDSMFSMATASKRRDLGRVRNDILASLKRSPAFAKSAIYVKPVGRDKDEKGNFKKDAKGNDVMKYARGLSIRAAEALAEAYGFNRVAVDTTVLDNEDVKVTATFTDFQNCRTWTTSEIVPRRYKARGGQIIRHDDDRFYNVVIKAKTSLAVREAILRCVAPDLKEDLYDAAEEEMLKFLTPEQVQKMLGNFAQKYKVTANMIEARLGCPPNEWTQEHRVLMMGLWNALEAGETSVEEAFGEPTPDDRAAAVKSKLEDAKHAEPAATSAPTIVCRKCLSKGQPADGPCGKCGDAEPWVGKEA